MEGKLITTVGLAAYTEQLKTFIDNTYQTKADMSLYTKTADLSRYLDTKYIAINSSLYCNPIYKHTITVYYTQYFQVSLTIFTTRAERYNNADEFRNDWIENRKIISVLADAITPAIDASHPSTISKGSVVGVIAVSGTIAVRISGLEAGNAASNWDGIYTLNRWNYWNKQENQQPNPCRI